MKKLQMPKGYAVMWSLFAGAYAVWMLLMRNTVLVTFESVAARTVDGVLYPDITGMTDRHWLYYIWVIASTASLLLFIFYLNKILYGNPGKGLKLLCEISLICGFIFATVYALLGDRYTLVEKVKYVTASMLGLDFPWLFRLWGVLTSMSVFVNTIYAYRKHGFNSRVGVILGSIGSAAIYMTINLPSIGENADFSNPRCLFHWLGALLFAFLCAAPLGILLFCMGKRGSKRFMVTFGIFIAIVIIMTTLLITVGKSALIENLPVWGAYIVMFILNFTSYYDIKTPEKSAVNARK